MNICDPKSNGSAITRKSLTDSKDIKSVGYHDKMQISHLTSHILITYEGDGCLNTAIVLECSPFGDQEPEIVAEDECQLTLKWAVKSACIPTGNQQKCSLFYADHLYDLNPLAHIVSNWKVENQTNSFMINICNGVLGESDCPSSAGICLKNKDKIEVLAEVDQMHLKMSTDGSELEMIFNNTKRSCNKDTPYTVSYVRFKCGQTSGRPEVDMSFYDDSYEKPMFLQHIPNECVYAFTWKTRLVCKNSTNVMSKVKIDNGIMLDSAHSNVRIDMNDILLDPRGFVDEYDLRKETNDFFVYYINFPGNKNCNNSIVCQFDKKNGIYRDIGSTVDFYAFDVYSEILEASVRTTNIDKCKNNDHVESIVRFYCDKSTLGNSYNSSFNFETESDSCVFIFNWPTSKLCVRDDWLNTKDFSVSSKVVPHYTTTYKSTVNYYPSSSSVSRIPSFVIIFLILISIVLLLLLFNNHEWIASFRIWRVIGTYCSRLKHVSWFGRTTRRSHPISPMFRRVKSRWLSTPRLHSVRYKKLNRDDKSQTYVRLNSNEDPDDFNANSSSDEVTALFDEKDNRRVLRLTSMTPRTDDENQSVPVTTNRTG